MIDEEAMDITHHWQTIPNLGISICMRCMCLRYWAETSLCCNQWLSPEEIIQLANKKWDYTEEDFKIWKWQKGIKD